MSQRNPGGEGARGPGSIGTQPRDSKKSQQELKEENEDSAQSLFTADEQICGRAEQGAGANATEARTVSPALFTLDESTPSPTTFSSIPIASSFSESKTTVASSSEVKSSQCSSVARLSIPDITFSCNTPDEGILYALPDVASNGPQSPVSQSVRTTSFSAKEKAEAS